MSIRSRGHKNIGIHSDHLQNLEAERLIVGDTPDEDLIARYKAGEVEASAALFAKHYRLALKIIIEVTRGKWYSDDCLQAASVGFLIGLNKFDPTKGVKVTTYVGHWIRKYVYIEVCNETLPMGGVLLGIPKRELLYRYLGLVMVNAAPEFIKEKLNIDDKMLVWLEEAAHLTSLSTILSGSEEEGVSENLQGTSGVLLLDEKGTDDDLFDEYTTTTLKELTSIILGDLPPLERSIVEHTYGIDGKQELKGKALITHLKDTGVIPAGEKFTMSDLANTRYKAVRIIKATQKRESQLRNTFLEAIS